MAGTASLPTCRLFASWRLANERAIVTKAARVVLGMGHQRPVALRLSRVCSAKRCQVCTMSPCTEDADSDEAALRERVIRMPIFIVLQSRRIFANAEATEQNWHSFIKAHIVIFTASQVRCPLIELCCGVRQNVQHQNEASCHFRFAVAVFLNSR